MKSDRVDIRINDAKRIVAIPSPHYTHYPCRYMKNIGYRFGAYEVKKEGQKGYENKYKTRAK